MNLMWLCFCLVATAYVRFVVGKEIVPSDLLISTVIDPSSETVSRDALTLLRSIRLFGGRLNEATVLVSIALNKGESLEDHSGLLNDLSDLGVEVDVIFQPEAPKPKTLNKFSTLDKFDATRFAYFLWLDADIVVFQDPLPYLQAHKRPGMIECAPEFYSYLRRYPELNSTSVVWNSAMSQLRTLGEGDNVPMGVCNTGVLFFDVMSLQRFVAALPEAVRKVDELNASVRDRFIDSLYFVSTVNAAEIDVHPLSYSMNYMAFFEKYIVEDTDTTQVVMAHFLHDAEFFCNVEGGAVQIDGSTGPEQCRCIFNNDFYLQDMPLMRAMSGVERGSNFCHFLAGAVTWSQMQNLPAPTVTTPSDLHKLVWPVENTVVHVYPSDLDGGGGARLLAALSPRTPGQLTCATSHVVLRMDACVRDQTLPASLCIDRGGEALSLEMVFTMDDDVCPGQSAANATLVIDGSNIGRYEVQVQLLFIRRLQTSTTAYSQNILVGRRPVLLDSLTMLPSFLNGRPQWKSMGSNTGVLACCGTPIGVSTVHGLIRRWRADVIVILVSAAPTGYAGGVEALVSNLRQACADTRVGDKACLVSSMNPSLAILPPFYPASLDLVFMDVFPSHDGYLKALLDSVEALHPHGMIVGTGFVDTVSRPVRSAVNKFCYLTQRAVMATFADKGPAAWYLEKLHILQSPPEEL